MTSFTDVSAFASIPRLTSLRLSPDGSWLAVGVQTAAGEPRKYVSSIWRLDTAAPDRAPVRLTRGAEGAGPDIRNYRVDFAKLHTTFPDLKMRWTVRDGIDELAAAYARYGLTYEDFVSSRYVRLRRIRELLDGGLVDEMLRRQTDGHFG